VRRVREDEGEEEECEEGYDEGEADIVDED
jgi:hypothetical protein